MKTKLILALMMITSLAAKSQSCDDEITNHVYIGAGAGYGTHNTGEGAVVSFMAGYATKVLGFDASIFTFPKPSSPSVISFDLTKPLFSGNTRVTVGAGASYNLVTNDNKALNSWKGNAYFEVARIANYSNAIFFARAQVTGYNFVLTAGIQGCFKKR